MLKAFLDLLNTSAVICRGCQGAKRHARPWATIVEQTCPELKAGTRQVLTSWWCSKKGRSHLVMGRAVMVRKEESDHHGQRASHELMSEKSFCLGGGGLSRWEK